MRLPRLLTWTLCLLPLVAAQAGVRTEQAMASLLSERNALVAGETAWLGLRIQHDPHWHTYWVNPGDSGLATRLDWRLPEGFSSGEVLWPRPQRLPAGPLTNFGYEDDLLLPVPVQVPAGLAPGAQVTIGLRADWLICEEICIPDGADLELTLPVAAAAAPDPRWQALFATARARAPAVYPGSVRVDMEERDFSFTLADAPVALMAAGGRAELFPFQTQLLRSERGEARAEAGTLAFTYARSDFFAGLPEAIDLLVAAGPGADDPAWVARVVPGDAAPASASASLPAPAPPGFALALLLAFLGGVLLNLMPCVFPVLSLKALGLAESAADPPKLRRHGWFYTAGVLLSFAVLAALLLALRAGGEAAGWGFQLQQPWFVAAMACFIFLLGLSLSGAFSFGASLMGLGQKQVGAGGDRGAFMTGVLACVVASPCTAPLMGVALGYAVTLPAPAAMTIFLALGFGLAFPLLLISLVPALSRWLPRPGRWMETFKQAMAFPLYLTALWLLWVLGRQVGLEPVIGVLAGMLLFAFALWLWPGPVSLAPATRRVAAVLIALPALWLVLPQGDAGSASAAGNGSGAMAFAPEALAALRAEGRPVLVNMTADWCITCKVNEHAALSGPGFHAGLAQHEVAYMVGDWTHSNPAITHYLAAFGRNGVPLYVLYPRGNGPPEVLPQILTPGLMRDALARAAASP
jgi:thiol:disulfide interchange protein/DsbC/DsbD-like thiol-disulfide interchange protein